ncbi:MAG: hypothetical protein U0800_08490 [Isosphaeraceae bacterium]
MKDTGKVVWSLPGNARLMVECGFAEPVHAAKPPAAAAPVATQATRFGKGKVATAAQIAEFQERRRKLREREAKFLGLEVRELEMRIHAGMRSAPDPLVVRPLTGSTKGTAASMARLYPQGLR